MRSASDMTSFMSCSISSTLTLRSLRTRRISAASSSFSDGFVPAAGSSNKMTSGSVAMARAISRRRRPP